MFRSTGQFKGTLLSSNLSRWKGENWRYIENKDETLQDCGKASVRDIVHGVQAKPRLREKQTGSTAACIMTITNLNFTFVPKQEHNYV